MIRLIAIGRLSSGPEADLFQRYVVRLRPKLALTELADGRGSAREIKQKETAALLAALPRDAFAVALDLGGHVLPTEDFAARVEQWAAAARPLCFLIGGAEGLGQAVIDRADFVLSLGKMTWPHILVRVMLVEQLYRAQAMMAGHPYHRAGRPGD